MKLVTPMCNTNSMLMYMGSVTARRLCQVDEGGGYRVGVLERKHCDVPTRGVKQRLPVGVKTAGESPH